MLHRLPPFLVARSSFPRLLEDRRFCEDDVGNADVLLSYLEADVTYVHHVFDCAVIGSLGTNTSTMGDLGPPCDFDVAKRATLPSLNPTKSFWQTSHPNDLVDYRSTPDLPKSADTIVIGSGITAVFAVKQLLETSSRARVLVVEARGICSGATGRNGGHLQPLVHEQPPHIIDFELSTFKLVESLIRKNDISCDFRKLSGCIGFWNRVYFEEAKGALAKARETDPSHADLVKVVEDPSELRKLGLRDAVGALCQSAAASLSPYRLVIWMWQDLLTRYPDRLNLQADTPVHSIDDVVNGSGTNVRTTRGSVPVVNGYVIVASNGYASYLVPELESVITPTQGQMSASTPPATFSNQLLPHSYGFLGVGDQDRVMSDYLIQAPLDTGGHLLYGGGRAFVPIGGSGVSDDSHVDLDAEEYLRSLPERLDLELPSRTTDRQRESSHRLDMVASWTGIMGYSKDHYPWVGRVPNRNIFLSAGYTGHGMTNAPACGRYIAQLVVDELRGYGLLDNEDAASPRQAIPEEYILTSARLAAAKEQR